MTARATSAILLVLTALTTALFLVGCGREFGPGEGPAGGNPPAGAARTDPTAEAARSKLMLQVQDPCYAGDPRRAWTRCARWVEETASSARTAARALPQDRAVTQGADAVAAGRDAFLERGCGTGAATAPPNPDACIGALGQARTGVHALALAVGGVPGA